MVQERCGVKRNFLALAERDFDLLIIGGGIIGAGIAWDASQRGLSCALIEKGDFASGTSSKTSKLIHGGIRYLENLDFKLVREAIRERETLLKLAPHLVKPLPFLIPMKGKSPRPWPIIQLGVSLYDWMAGKGSVAGHRFLSGQEVAEKEPILALANAERGTIYHDAQMDDARLVLETVQAAAQSGAIVVNHCAVLRLLIEKKRVVGAELEDELTRQHCTLRARQVVNATGPWVDQIRRMADPSARPVIRPSKGIHLVYPDLGLKHAILLSSTRDQRIFFLIPWKGLTLIGTTDTDYEGDPGESTATRVDVEYLLGETNQLLPGLRLEKSKILSTFSGVRPLVAQEKKDPWAVSRGHRIHQDRNGLVSVLGGKFTTFRKIAEDGVDQIARRFPGKKLAPCRTSSSPLGQERLNLRNQKIFEWLQEDPQQKELLCNHHPFIRADVRWAIEEEMAVSLSDLFFRRLEIAHSACHGLDALAAAAQVMGKLLAWDSAESQRQINRYQEEISATHRF